MKKHMLRGVALAAVSVAGAPVMAADFDPTTVAGRVFDAGVSVPVFPAGATAVAVRRWTPWLLDEASSAQNNAVVQIVNGRVFGAVSTFSSTGNPRLVVSFGTADALDAAGGYSSNDVLVAESLNHSNTIGNMLADGKIVYRANFAGTAQNNIEWVQGTPGAQSVPVEVGNEILSGPGTTGGSSTGAFLGTPGAIEDDSTSFFMGQSNFTNDATVPVGVNIWRYTFDPPTPLPVLTPTYTYSQAAAESTYGIPSGSGRQTQVRFAKVNGVNYVIHGVGNTTVGGSARPSVMVVDAFEDGDGYTGAIAINAPSGFRFIDHQATGGGASPFQNARFAMNSLGKLVVATESIATSPRVYQVLSYQATFDTSGRINGFTGPTIIADAAQSGGSDVVPEGLSASTFVAVSGVAVNELGNIAFTASYDAAGTARTAAYFFDATAGVLHQVARELDVITGPDTGSGAPSVTLGILPQDSSDGFFAAGLAPTANVMALTFRDQVPVALDRRGALVIAIGGLGDANFDGRVGESDLGILLSAWQSVIGTPEYDPQSDYNADGRVDEADLGSLLGNWNP